MFKLLYRWFIPGTVLGSSENTNRARILVAVIYISALMTLCAWFTCAWVLPLDPGNIQIAGFFCGMVTLCCFFSLLFFRLTGRFNLAVNLFVSSAYLAIVGSVVITGGHAESPSLQMLIVCPVYALLLAGRSVGLAWSVLVVVTGLLFFGLDLAGLAFPQVMSESSVLIVDASIWMLLCAIVIVTVGLYDGIYQGLKTKLHAERNAFAYRATHDVLTGLPNRAMFNERLEHALERSLRSNQKNAVCYIDLDGFKPVNDRYGHPVGDQVLIELSQRMTSTVREVDTVASLGGDEFAILLEELVDADSAIPVIEKLLQQLADPILIDDRDIRLSASIGIALFPDDSSDADKLSRLADKAMYQAKKTKGRYCFYCSEMAS